MLFIDTCYLLSLINVMEKNHEKAVQLLEYIDEEETLINSTVLLEMLNKLKKKRYEKYRDTIIDLIYNMDNIHYLTTEEYNKSLNTCKDYDFSINFSDCTILESMKQFNVTHIVSFDSDFDKANNIKRIYL
ncbi:MAG: PIN domain-containing protein [archaeon]|nr:PIN domain-containing protein [archaeon]